MMKDKEIKIKISFGFVILPTMLVSGFLLSIYLWLKMPVCCTVLSALIWLVYMIKVTLLAWSKSIFNETENVNLFMKAPQLTIPDSKLILAYHLKFTFYLSLAA